MNKVTTAVGLAVLSAASVKAQFGIGLVSGQLTPLESSKPWSLTASVRGFYDDNYLALPKTFIVPYVTATGTTFTTNHPISAWGTDLTAGAAVNHLSENTLISANYTYDFIWYDNRPTFQDNASDTINQVHQFNGRLQHDFSDRYKLSVNENFVVAQEPEVLAAETGPEGGIATSPLRYSGSNIRNNGQVDFIASLTKLVDLHLGYGNTIYWYQQHYAPGYPFTGAYSAEGNPPVPSYSDELDRMEQLVSLDLRWKITPETTGLLGYQYGHTAFTSSGYIIYPYGGDYPYAGPTAAPGVPGFSSGYRSDIRNSDSHFGFIGADQAFSPELNGSLRLGGEYLDYYNYGTSRFSPYVDGNLTYQYLPGDSAQIGVKHIHNPTDVVGYIGSTPVLDEESTAIYVADSHRLAEKLTVSVLGQAQISTFVGGGPNFDGKTDQFFLLNINFAYHFNPWLLAETGYNYSKLNSDLLERSYTRDVMYLGFRAVY